MESVVYKFKDNTYISVGSKWYIKIKELYLGFNLQALLEFKSSRIFEVTKIDIPEFRPDADGYDSNIPNTKIYIYLTNGVMDVSIPYDAFDSIFKEVPEDVSNTSKFTEMLCAFEPVQDNGYVAERVKEEVSMKNNDEFQKMLDGLFQEPMVVPRV